MLDRLRGSLKGVMASLGSTASKLMPNPSAWTWVGTLFAVSASAFYAGGHSFTGGMMVLLSGFFDVLDGAVARATKRATPRGAFLDSTLDRVSELAIYLGILVGGYASPLFVLLALSLSLLVSYTRAKGDSLRVDLAGIGVGERSERLAVLIVASLVSLVWLGVILVFVLALVTFAERSVRVSLALGRRDRPTT